MASEPNSREQVVQDLFQRFTGGVAQNSTLSSSDNAYADIIARYRQYAGPTLDDLIAADQTASSVSPAQAGSQENSGFNLDWLKAIGAEFSEGLAYDADLFDIDEETQLHPWVASGSRFAGHLVRELGLVFVSGGLVSIASNSVRAIPWFAKLASWGNRVISKAPTLLKAFNKTAPVANTVIREGIEGAVYSGISQLIAPEEFKPGVEGTVLNVAQFSAGGVGMRWARGIMDRHIPNAPESLKRFAGLAGDSLFGAATVLGITQDPKMFTQQFGAELIAIALIDQLSYALTKGHLNDTPEVRRLLEKAQQAQNVYRITGSKTDEEQMFKAIEAAWRKALPEGADLDPRFADKLNDRITSDWTNDVLKVQESQGKRIEQEIAGERPSPVEVKQTSIAAEDVMKTFRYRLDDLPRIQEQLPLMMKWAEAAGFDPATILAIAKIESDFTDVKGRGPLQVTKQALDDLKRSNIHLENSFDTLEGRIEAGVKYLQLLRDRYGFQGDELIAAYFAGPTYIRKNGITDQVIAGQISPREYVNRWKNSLMQIQSGPKSQGFDNPFVLQETLAQLGYDVGPIDGIIGPRTLEAIKTFQKDHGLKVDGVVGPKTKAALEEAVNTSGPGPFDGGPRPSPSRVPVEPPAPPRPVPQERPVETQRSTPEQEVPRQTQGAEQPETQVNVQVTRRLLWSPKTGQKRIEFDDPDLALLYDLGAEWSRRAEGLGRRSDVVIESWETHLAQRFGVDISEVSDLAEAFHKQVTDTARNLPKDGDVLRVGRDSDLLPERLRQADSQMVRDTELIRDPEQARDTERPRGPVDRFDEVMEQLLPPRRRVTSSTTTRTDAEVPQRTPLEAPPRDDAEIRAAYEKTKKELEQWLLENAHKPLTREKLEEFRTKFKPSLGYSINTTRYTASGEVLRVMKQFADVLKDDSVQSLKQVKAGAQKMLKSEARSTAEQLGLVYEAVEALEKVMTRAPELVNALRAINTSVAAELQALAAKIATQGGDDLEMVRFIELQEMMALLTGKFTRIQQQAGRILGAFRVYIGSKMVDVSDLTLTDLQRSVDAREKVNAIIDAAGGKKAIIKKAKEIAESKDLSTIAATARKNSVDKVLMRALAEYRQANILTNLRVSVTNFTSQLLNSLFEHTSNLGAATIGMLLRNRDRITYGEVVTRIVYDILGAVQAVFRPVVGLRDAVAITRFKDQPSHLDVLAMALNPRGLEELIQATSFDSRTAIEGGSNTPYAHSETLKQHSVGRFLSKMPASNVMWWFLDQAAAFHRALGFGLQELADRPFAYGAYASELAGRLHRMRRHLPDQVTWTRADGTTETISKKEYTKRLYQMTLARRREKILAPLINRRAMSSGLTGEELQAEIRRVADELTGGVLRGVDENTLKLIDELDQAALAHSRYMTWKDPINNQILKTFEEVIRRHPTLRIIAPFYHTPIKIAEKWAESSGLGKKFYQDVRGLNGPRARDLALARLAVSLILYGVGYSLAVSNLITPTARNSDERRRMEEAGIPENSIKIGDTWVQYSKLTPAPAMYLMTMANVVHLARTAEDDETALEIAFEGLFSILNGVMDQPWLTGTRIFLDALQDPDKAKQLLGELSDTVVPLHGLRRWADTTFEEYRNEVNNFWDRFAPKFDRLDTFGKRVANYDYVLGLRYSDETDSPIRQELVNLGITLSRLEDRVLDVKLTPEEYWRMRRYLDTGLHAEERLNRLVTDPRYLAAPRQTKIDMIRSEWDKIKEEARKWILRDPEVRRRYTEEMKKKGEEARKRDYPFEWFERLAK